MAGEKTLLEAEYELVFAGSPSMARFRSNSHSPRCDRRDPMQASLNGTGLTLF